MARWDKLPICADPVCLSIVLAAAAQHLFRLYRLRPDKIWWAEGMVPCTEVAW